MKHPSIKESLITAYEINRLYLKHGDKWLDYYVPHMDLKGLKTRSALAVWHLKNSQPKTLPQQKKIKPFTEYKREVWKLTEEQPLHTLPNIEKRSFKGYHLDHKVSIWDGFKKGLPINQVADISNLRMIPAHENMLKGRKSI